MAHHLVVEVHTEFNVYIGRPGIWGNPFFLDDPTDDRARYSCVLDYAHWLAFGGHYPKAPQANEARRSLVLSSIGQLRGAILGCHCAPRLCHGDVLARIAAGANPIDVFHDLDGKRSKFVTRDVDRDWEFCDLPTCRVCDAGLGHGRLICPCGAPQVEMPDPCEGMSTEERCAFEVRLENEDRAAHGAPLIP